MSNNNESINVHQDYFEFLKENGELVLNENGKPMLALKKEYRGEKSDNYPASEGDGTELELPEMLIIPEIFDNTTVEVLAPGMFANNKRIKGITLPSEVKAIPEAFCLKAANFRILMGTENIRSIGYAAFYSTRIKNALFPNLTEWQEKEMVLGGEERKVGRTFLNCAYLEVIDIGKVTTIPGQAFSNCALLRKVIRNIDEVETVTFKIGYMAFTSTYYLRELPLLEYATNVEANAFFYSGIRAESLPEGSGIAGNAFPITENEESWAALKPTQCQNRLITKLSQLNPAWAKESFLQGEPAEANEHTYSKSCAFFATMHIHSAISGKYYHHPCEFVQELKDRGLSQYVHTDGWPGDITQVPKMFEDLGYRTEICGKHTDLTIEDYQKLADALADGAYIYTQVSISNDIDYGHAAVIYGITGAGEVCVLDSNVLFEGYRDYGFEPNTDIYTYTIPFTNIVGPESNFIIVYPPEKKTVVERTICAVDNAFTSASLPSEYPMNWVTTCCVTNDAGLPSPHNGILTAYRGEEYAYRTFVPHDQAALHMQMKSLDEEDGDKWLEWSTFGSAGTTNDSSGETPSAE